MTELWHNGLPKDPWDFWWNAPLQAQVSKMYLACDGTRIIRRVTSELGDVSTSGRWCCN